MVRLVLEKRSKKYVQKPTFLHVLPTWSDDQKSEVSKHSPGAWSWSLKHWRLKNCKCSMANGEACMTYFSLTVDCTYSLQSLTLLLTHYTNGTPVLWSLMHWCSVICNLCMVHNNVSDHLILILILIQIQSGTGSKSSEYRVTEHRVSQSTELVTEYWGLVTDGWWL